MDAGTIVILGGFITTAGTVIVALVKTRGVSKDTQQNREDRFNDRVDERLESLEEKYTSLIEDRDSQRAMVGILGDGFDALSSVVERIDPAPVLSPWELSAINRAKELRADDTLWPSVTRTPKH